MYHPNYLCCLYRAGKLKPSSELARISTIANPKNARNFLRRRRRPVVSYFLVPVAKGELHLPRHAVADSAESMTSGRHFPLIAAAGVSC